MYTPAAESFIRIVAWGVLLVAGCQPQALPDQANVHVLSVSEATVDASASAQEGAPGICQSWSLTTGQAERFYRLGEDIDKHRYHHDFDTAPCAISGTLESGGRAWAFDINGAAKAILRDRREVRCIGCTAPACKDVVMWEYVPPDVD